MFRLIALLMLIAVPAYGQCEDKDLRGTWRIYTTPLDMGGTICTTSCQFRIGKGNRVMTPPSDCSVRNTPFLEEASFPIERGFMHYSSRLTLPGTDNNIRYAVVSARWTFNTPGGVIRWDFDGEQEHSWGKRKGMKKGAIKCRTKKSAKTIHGRVLVYRDNVVVGQASARMVWRSLAENLKPTP